MNPRSNVSKWFTYIVSPFAMLVGGTVAVKAQTWFNLKVDPLVVAAFVLAVVGGIAHVASKWVHNRGMWEIAHVLHVSPTTLQGIETKTEEDLPAPPTVPDPPATAPPRE